MKARALGCVAGFGLALSGCAALPATTVVADLTTAQQAASAAVSLYGIAKGIALQAAPAAPALSRKIAQADTIVATAQTALADVTTDAPTLLGLAAQVQAQANALTATAAPKVSVVPNS